MVSKGHSQDGDIDMWLDQIRGIVIAKTVLQNNEKKKKLTTCNLLHFY